MAKISETELQRRLKALERKTSTKESNYLSSVDPIAGSFTEGDTHYNATTDNLWLFSNGTWSIDASVLHVRYADAVTTNPPTVQSQVTNFSTDPLNPSGSLKAWRGLWWGGLTATTDPTDYEWFDITSSPSAMTRYYSEDTGLRADMGTPSKPVEGVTWVLGGATTNTAWLADRFTIDGKVGPWEIYPVKPMEQGLPLIRYVKAGSNAPTLNDSVWIADVIIAAQSFTGRPYSNQMELGYGTVCVIKYDDAVLSGKFTQVSGVNTWVSAGETIDGSLVVSGTVAADKIQANSITATQIAAGAITASEIAADAVTADKLLINDYVDFSTNASGIRFTKTTLNDATAGAYYGRGTDSAGNSIAGFNVSSPTGGIYADSTGLVSLRNVRLFTGGPGTPLAYPNPGLQTAQGIAAGTTSIDVVIVGAGAGACTNSSGVYWASSQIAGANGTASWFEFRNASNQLVGSRITAAGGTGGFSVGSNNSNATGYSGASSSQANSAGAGSSGSAAPSNGSKGGGGGGAGNPNPQNYSYYAPVTFTAGAGSTYSASLSVPSGATQFVVFVGQGGAGAYFFYPGSPNGNQPAFGTIRGGNGGDGYVTVADPNSGGIEVDLVSVINRITTLEGHHP
jgi:hypothetical protein